MMRIFISFEDSREPFHVSPDQTVEAVKQMVKVEQVLKEVLFWDHLCLVTLLVCIIHFTLSDRITIFQIYISLAGTVKKERLEVVLSNLNAYS